MAVYMRRKALIVVLAVVVRLCFLFYRDYRLEHRRLQQEQEVQLQEQKFQALKREAAGIRDKEEAKAELQTDPSKFLIGGTARVIRRGSFFVTYSRVIDITVANISRFDVTAMAGDLTYVSDTGKEISTVPFTAEGDIGAGQTTKMKITATEVKGTAQQGHIIVNNVRIAGGSN
jgi:hypothetical protein